MHVYILFMGKKRRQEPVPETAPVHEHFEGCLRHFTSGEFSQMSVGGSGNIVSITPVVYDRDRRGFLAQKIVVVSGVVSKPNAIQRALDLAGRTEEDALKSNGHIASLVRGVKTAIGADDKPHKNPLIGEALDQGTEDNRSRILGGLLLAKANSEPPAMTIFYANGLTDGDSFELLRDFVIKGFMPDTENTRAIRQRNPEMMRNVAGIMAILAWASADFIDPAVVQARDIYAI